MNLAPTFRDAAPDMFAALERCESVLRDIHKLHPRFVRWDAEKLLPVVLAALAKARGEA